MVDQIHHRKTLALAFIMKNEGAYAVKMIKSVINIVDFVSVFDNLSTDGSVETVRRFLGSANVHYTIRSGGTSFFDEMRNHAIDAVPIDYEWILMLDSDELILEKHHDELLSLTNQDLCDAWLIPRFNYLTASDDMLSVYPDHQGRLFRHGKDHAIRYRRKLHELLYGYSNVGWVPAQDNPQPSTSGLHIQHMKHRWKSRHEIEGREVQYRELSKDQGPEGR